MMDLKELQRQWEEALAKGYVEPRRRKTETESLYDLAEQMRNCGAWLRREHVPAVNRGLSAILMSRLAADLERLSAELAGLAIDLEWEESEFAKLLRAAGPQPKSEEV